MASEKPDSISEEVEANGVAERTHDQLRASAYHARPEVSQSQWKLLPEKPDTFNEYHVEKRTEFKQTEDMKLGTLLHGVLLEKEPLLIIPEDVLSKSGSKAGGNWLRWKEDHPNNEGIKEKDAGRIRRMIESCKNCSVIRDMIDAPGVIEHSIFWIDPTTGIPCRCRLDKRCDFPNGYILYDCKSTSIDPADERQVNAHIFGFGYHMQAAAYWDAATKLWGKPPLRFIFGFVRNKPPYNSATWYLEEMDMDLGRRHNAIALHDLKERRAKNDWTHYRSRQLNLAHLPKYAWTDDPLNPSAPFQEFEEYST
jgi:PDDEXK-like domain of unknown function (DUF3799)